jgi:hypothetical protein
MFTAYEYRAKAAEYGRLLEMARSPSETSEYRDLHQSYSLLADNLEWLTTNAGKVVVNDQRSAPRVVSNQSSAPRIESREGEAERVEEERILRCLGVAVVLNWNTVPPKLQHALFEDASSIQRGRGAPLKGVLARFLHDHKDDAQRQQQQNGGSNAGAS